MTRREQAKDQKRDRICAAAEYIIRREGIEKLTMRRLAEQAGVSLRTPYNLLGSKTDVLIALLEGAELDPALALNARHDQLIIEQLLGALDQVEAFFASDEDFYRAVYGSIMASNHHDVRDSRIEQVVAACRKLVSQAAAHGELRRDTNAEQLGRYLAIQLVAVLGMWGAGFVTIRECIRQVRGTWAGILLNHCSDSSRSTLGLVYQATLLIDRD